jgi:hypothetical protein
MLSFHPGIMPVPDTERHRHLRALKTSAEQGHQTRNRETGVRG